MMMVLPFLLNQKPLPWGGVWGRLFYFLKYFLPSKMNRPFWAFFTC